VIGITANILVQGKLEQVDLFNIIMFMIYLVIGIGIFLNRFTIQIFKYSLFLLFFLTVYKCVYDWISIGDYYFSILIIVIVMNFSFNLSFFNIFLINVFYTLNYIAQQYYKYYHNENIFKNVNNKKITDPDTSSLLHFYVTVSSEILLIFIQSVLFYQNYKMDKNTRYNFLAKLRIDNQT